MDFARHNRDLHILTSQEERSRQRFDLAPAWTAVDWKPTQHGGNMIYIRQMVLPQVCSRRRTDVKIEAPPNLYEPAGGSGYHFYRNIWVAPGLEVWDPRQSAGRSFPACLPRPEMMGSLTSASTRDKHPKKRRFSIFSGFWTSIS